MKWWIGIATVVLLAVAPLILPAYGLSLMNQVLIFGLFAMSLDVLMGYIGLVSFNQASFLGISAYTVGILLTRGVENFWLCLFAGVAAALVLALLLGWLVLRTSGPYFLMLTLAFGQMLYSLACRWRSLTGGDDGLAGIPRPELGLPLSMWDNGNFYYLTFGIFLISFFLLRWLAGSSLGRAITGVRESESRMQALGYHTGRLKYLAYVIAGGFAGVAGVLFIYYNGFISPQELNWTMSGQAILMVIIGGAGTRLGPVVGAGVILVLQNLVSTYTDHWPLFMGLLFVVCVMYLRDGIVGYLNKTRHKGWMSNDSIGSEEPD